MIFNDLILTLMSGESSGSGGGCPYTIYTVDQQLGTYASTSSSKPFYGLYNYSISACLYSPSTFGSDQCQITSAKIKLSSFTTPYTVNNQEIWVGEVSNTTFPTTTPQVDFSDLTFVTPLTLVKGPFNFTLSSNGNWNEFIFDTPYCYSGAGTLIFVWKNYDGSWASGYGTSDVANVGSKAMYKGNDASFPTGTGTRDNFPILIRFGTKINNLYSLSTQAFSLRKLIPDYTGFAIKVRRSSDSTTLDIGFDGSGNLDTATLLTFVGAGSGYVQTWYDQSGNALDRTQNTTANQPTIVSSGTLITENGKPALYFDGVNDFFGSVTQSWTPPFNILSVATLNSAYNTGLEYAIIGGSSTYYAKMGVKANKYHFNHSASSTGASSTVNADINQHLYTALFDVNGSLRIDGTSVATTTSFSATASTYSFLGKDYSTNYWFGTIQEMIHIPNDQSAIYTTLNNLIKTYYGII